MTDPLPTVLLVVLLGAVLLLALLLYREKHRSGQMEYRRGLHDGKEALRQAIRYEQEIFDCKRAGIVRKETLLKVRESILLENLRIATWEREVVLDAQVDLGDVWQALDRVAQLAPQAQVGEVARRIAPAAGKVLELARKK